MSFGFHKIPESEPLFGAYKGETSTETPVGTCLSCLKSIFSCCGKPRIVEEKRYYTSLAELVSQQYQTHQCQNGFR